MINPYQASQTSIEPACAPPLPRTASRKLVDAVLIWFGVMFGAHAGVALDEGFNIQAAANRGLSNPLQTLYFFLPVGACVIVTVACWSRVRFHGQNRYHVLKGIRFPGGVTIGCATYLIASWLEPAQIFIPLVVLIATSVIYLEVESLFCKFVLISTPTESGFSDHGA